MTWSTRSPCPSAPAVSLSPTCGRLFASRMSTICSRAAEKSPRRAQPMTSCLCQASHTSQDLFMGRWLSTSSSRLILARNLASAMAQSWGSCPLLLRKMQRPLMRARAACCSSLAWQACWCTSCKAAKNCCCNMYVDLSNSTLTFSSRFTSPPTVSPAGRNLSAKARSTLKPHQHAPVAPKPVPSFAQGIHGKTCIVASRSCGRDLRTGNSVSRYGGSCLKLLIMT
mmetsp:Transcript_66426/g.214083  ORF Transcript_66426/g.214083 Transcript_66426/m.214083 type:complete len:226 (+) Transcript_66426:259-936(+)